MMKTTPIFRLLIVLLLGATPSLTFAGQANKVKKANPANTANQDTAVRDNFAKEFDKQPENIRKEYSQLWRLMQQQVLSNNMLGTLDACDNLEKLIPGNASVYNTKGTIHLKLKDIPRSKENFMKACELAPKNDTFRFNLSETFFVNHEYEKAIELFEQLLSKVSKKNDVNSMTKSLIEFKLFISYTKLGNKEKADTYAGLYTINDDTPFYYCVRGIDKWEQGKKQEAQSDFSSAINIYAPSGMYQPFGDSLAETGYIESLEGPTVPLPKKE